MSLWLLKENLSRQLEYHLTFSSEGNTVTKVVGWLGYVNSLIDFGRRIGIIQRIYVRSVDPPVNAIALFNFKVILKSKDNFS